LRIYLDENVDVRVAAGLKRRAIDARTAAEESKLGATDVEQLAHATTLRAALVTHDHHFIELAQEKVHGSEPHFGVIFVELQRFGIGECVRRLALYAELVTAEEMMNRVEFL
jgi:predicted nuclease of predicted toxin-antitoxin system